MSYLLRQKVIVAIDKEPHVLSKDAKKFVIYLPEGERQELSLLFMHYILKSRQHHVIYLGQDISLDDLKDCCCVHKPDYVFTLINEPFAKTSAQQYLDNLANHFINSTILISGYQIVTKELIIPSNTHVLKSLDDTIEYIDAIKAPNVRRVIMA